MVLRTAPGLSTPTGRPALTRQELKRERTDGRRASISLTVSLCVCACDVRVYVHVWEAVEWRKSKQFILSVVDEAIWRHCFFLAPSDLLLHVV